MEMQHEPQMAAWQVMLTHVRGILTRWRRVLAHDAIAIVEIIFGAGALIWGLWLLGPWDAFAAPGWVVIRATGIPESVYGAIFATLGLTQMIQLPSRPAHVLVMLSLMVCWCLVWLALFVISPGTTGIPIYAFPAVVQIGLVLRGLSDPGPGDHE